ncbi:MAG: hypothetical protein PT944_06365 [Actinomycetaceae bacterium]|nr:hypothetical protein [Actinomycetaceae bacterium]
MRMSISLRAAVIPDHESERYNESREPFTAYTCDIPQHVYEDATNRVKET